MNSQNSSVLTTAISFFFYIFINLLVFFPSRKPIYTISLKVQTNFGNKMTGVCMGGANRTNSFLHPSKKCQYICLVARFLNTIPCWNKTESRDIGEKQWLLADWWVLNVLETIWTKAKHFLHQELKKWLCNSYVPMWSKTFFHTQYCWHFVVNVLYVS